MNNNNKLNYNCMVILNKYSRIYFLYILEDFNK